MFVLYPLAAAALILALVYLNGKYNEMYWKKRGVLFHTKNKVMGPVWDFLTQDRPLFAIFDDLYKQYPNEPAVGIGSFLTPALYVKDPQNVQHILQSDFQSFNHRDVDINEGDLLADNILLMHGPRWKLMRQKMSPLFTATKLKQMYYINDKSSQDFVEFLKKNPEKLKGDAFNTLSHFCSAAIGASVFGISTKSIFDSPFLKMAQEATESTLTRNLKFAIGSISSPLSKALGLQIFKEYQEFFIGAIKQIIRQREKENVVKHDFADICVSLQKNGVMRDSETGFELEPTDELLAAQAFFFFIAGVEPSATAIFGTLIELGNYPEILSRVHNEIDEAFEKHNDQLNYDAVVDMEYLDKVLSEGLRMHPPIGFLTRRCVRDTVLPVGNIRIEKGTKMFLPTFEYHHDPIHYPNPEVFDPERFAKDTKAGDIDYLPFGKGGRMCIGMRYARIQVKAVIVHLLRHYTIQNISGKGGIKYSKKQVQVRPANIDIEFVPRKIKS